MLGWKVLIRGWKDKAERAQVLSSLGNWSPSELLEVFSFWVWGEG